MFQRSKNSKNKNNSNPVGSVRIVEAQKQLGAIACKDSTQRSRARFIGEVKSIRIVPRGVSYWFEVVISDGTGKINGWFFGRKSIPGIQPGSIILFEGLVQLDEGEMTIANPYYEIL